MESWYYVHTLSLAEVGSMALCVHPWVGRMESVGLCTHLVCGGCHGQVQGSEVCGIVCTSCPDKYSSIQGEGVLKTYLFALHFSSVQKRNLS